MASQLTGWITAGQQDLLARVNLVSSGLDEAPVASIDLPQETQPDEPQEPIPRLSDLAQLLRLGRYQRRKCLQLQHNLHCAYSEAARTSRLLLISRSVQRTLGQCIKAEDKHSFVNLLNAFHDSLSGGLLHSAGPVHATSKRDDGCVGYPACFLDRLPSSSRSQILDFICKVRHDGHFIADRLASLSHRELETILPEKGQAKSSDSIFGSSQRSSSRASRHLGFAADTQTDLLASLEFGSALETLVYAVRGLSSAPLYRDAEPTDVWSTVCANLILEQKHGSEKVVPAVIQLWAASSKWAGKDRLSNWMADLIQRGTPLLDQTQKQSFRVRSGIRTELDVQEDNRLEAFYQESVDSLLALLAASTDTGVLPEGALLLCQEICRKLEAHSTHKQAFPYFVLTRWLFLSFLPDIAHGILTDHFISDTVRQRLLREVTARCSRSVYGVVYSWKYGAPDSTDVRQVVNTIAGKFDIQQPEGGRVFDFITPPVPANEEVVVPLTAADLNTLVTALYPQRAPAKASSERDPSRTGLHSSSSSVSGFSLFQTPGTAPTGYTSPASGNAYPVLSEKFSDDHVVTDLSRLDPGIVEGEQLREICAAIDDMSASQTPTGSHEWSLLRTGADGLSTVRRILCEEALGFDGPSSDNMTSTMQGSPDTHKCRAAVEELLIDEDLKQHWSPDLSKPEPPLDEVQETIKRAFVERTALCDDSSDFISAHTWHRRLRKFRKVLADDNDPKPLSSLLTSIESFNRSSLDEALAVERWCVEPLRNVSSLTQGQSELLRQHTETMSRLRDKMWYVAEVRTSAAYDEARSVASALKVMGKVKRPTRAFPAPPLRHWNGFKGPAASFHLKTEAQVLEILSAPPGHGGPNKLSDDQSRALSAWLDRNAVENLCKGEERLQRLCLEIRKAVTTITSDGSATWSSILFARSQVADSGAPKSPSYSPLFQSRGYAGRQDLFSVQTNVPPSIDSISSASSHPLSARSSRDYLETRSPTLTNKSSGPFWSPSLTDTQSPSSATSIGSSYMQPAFGLRSNLADSAGGVGSEQMKEQVRQRLTSLLISDLTLPAFATGSETDRAFWSGLGGELTEKHLRNVRLTQGVGSPDTVVQDDYQFDYSNAFSRLLQSFASTSNPFEKLRYLADVNTLLKPYMADQAAASPRSHPKLLNGLSLNTRDTAAVPDIMVEGFRRLFSNSQQRPTAIFRDLQYIAALVPSPTLSATESKAFWNATIAILRLKQEATQLMVETADSIIAYHSMNRGSGRSSSSTAQQERDSATFTVPNRTPSAEDIGKYTMAHAAELLQITAKEGDAVAQRELATLYLTHPELMDHIIAPLSRPRDVFKEELEGKWKRNQDPHRCDPATMCVAHHWMSLSALGGDALAKEYLRQREEMDRLGE
ncbi:uncharacterized protein LTR77_008009 [Saxophila tyrrhenica]|uniref:Uncharacterized protein n=1 Tax=Saxophila tyrrhenica TaxID=1690608 RepID=A0AAV9P4D8_9PEZI|nr:hypothetical protein LTR77_008009 [Saxophila tyrrhenica]